MSGVELKSGNLPLSETKQKLLEKLLRGEFARTRSQSEAISRRPLGEPAPLSLTQEELWRLEVSTPGIPPLFNESFILRRAAPLDADILEHCLVEILRRHEIWRTSYQQLNGNLVQVIHPAPTRFALPVVDLRSMAEELREAEALRRAEEQAAMPFNLEQGPLLRAMLVKFGESDSGLVITGHQSILDGVSVYQIFPSEMAVLYEAFSAGRPSPLPEPHFQFADFAYWQRKWLSGAIYQEQLTYWRKCLAGEIPALEWPRNRPRPARLTYRGAFEPFTWPANLVEALRSLSHSEGSTLFTSLLAGFAAVLHCYSRQSDIIVGTLSPSGRKRTEVQGIMGYFLNPVALRMNLAGDPRFRDLLRQAQQVTSEAISHDDLPFGRLAEELKPKPYPSRHPFLSVMVSLQPSPPDLAGGWSVAQMDASSGGARWDLYVEFADPKNQMLGHAQYNPDVFDVKEIRKFVKDVRDLLEAGAANPDRSLSELTFSMAKGQR